ncbi:hypothetical protein LAV_00202 [Sphingobium phage Lacusarx]|uniref:Uncharacterized protein n=1 Tax=Sphingobium phage Lacusarx TaxID=1980139 RepID=A0A1W6DX37_9CAUD|nr:hypothetical protein FDH44_gp101 [Sphingobium phage Lacusarx]ARK07577.1 hypothetical protein LAV_00202 [Sphingobium phage Lacusarx]
MANMSDAIAQIHAARRLVQRIMAPGETVDRVDMLDFLAESEVFLVEDCGHRARYWKPGDEEGA